MHHPPVSRSSHQSMYCQVTTAILIGVLFRHFYRTTGEGMNQLGDGFIELILEIIAPVSFLNVVARQQITLLPPPLLTSKGAAGVTEGGFIKRSALRHVLLAGLALLLRLDRFLSVARAQHKLIGKGVSPLVVAQWAGESDTERLSRHLDGEPSDEPDAPEFRHDATAAHRSVSGAR